jgi:hypothetical protein
MAGPSKMPILAANDSVNNLQVDPLTSLTVNATRILTVCGNFNNAGTINLDGTLEVKGNFLNTGTINFGASSKIIFDGGAAQTVNTSSNLTVPSLVIANTSGGVSLATGNISVSGTLTLTSGIVTTTATSMIKMLSGSTTSSIGTSTCFINGPMQKIGNVAYVFPIGKGTKLEQLEISACSSK